MAKTTSAARTKSNRENAKHSTGPRTAKGKAVVKWNAQKHGLLAKEVVISSGEGKESQAEFDQLLEALASELEPVGILEEIQVERIAVGYWRLKRVLQSEAGEIKKGICRLLPLPSFIDNADVQMAIIIANMGHVPAESQLLETSSGIVMLFRMVSGCRKEIEQSGALGETNIKCIMVVFGSASSELGFKIQTYNCCAKGEYPKPYTDLSSSSEQIIAATDIAMGARASGKKPPYEPAEAKQKLLEIFAGKEAAYDQAYGPVRQAEEMLRESKLASLAIPTGEVLARLQRYETTIDRQLSRAMSELERLQKARRGATPPPISIGPAE